MSGLVTNVGYVFFGDERVPVSQETGVTHLVTEISHRLHFSSSKNLFIRVRLEWKNERISMN